MGKPKNFETSQFNTMAQWRGSIDDLVTCPYDSSHVMKYCRMQIHIIKCAEKLRRTNPSLFKNFLVCDYNSLHRFPKEKMEQHLKECKEHILSVQSRLRAGKSPYVKRMDSTDKTSTQLTEAETVFDAKYVTEWI